jgi:hypothetical protein
MAPAQRERDPYYRCELHCTHDLGSGMSIAELLGPTEPARRGTWLTPRRSHRLNAAPGGTLARTASGS